MHQMAVRLRRSLASVGQSDQSRGNKRCQNPCGLDAESLGLFKAPFRVDRLLLEVTLVSLKR